jgi:hypothetical protein
VTNTAKTWLIVGIIAAVLLLIACIITLACLGIAGVWQSDSGVTLANFNRVETGMTYAEVSEIFGGPGDLSMETELAGTKMEVYSWRAKMGFGNATISFTDGRVASKVQFGLK